LAVIQDITGNIIFT